VLIYFAAQTHRIDAPATDLRLLLERKDTAQASIRINHAISGNAITRRVIPVLIDNEPKQLCVMAVLDTAIGIQGV
jgi:hypothetical protein